MYLQPRQIINLAEQFLIALAYTSRGVEEEALCQHSRLRPRRPRRRHRRRPRRRPRRRRRRREVAFKSGEVR